MHIHSNRAAGPIKYMFHCIVCLKTIFINYFSFTCNIHTHFNNTVGPMASPPSLPQSDLTSSPLKILSYGSQLAIQSTISQWEHVRTPVSSNATASSCIRLVLDQRRKQEQ